MLLQPQMHIMSEDSMAVIWVIFGHLAVIPKNEKGSANNGKSNPGFLACISERLTTVPPPPQDNIVDQKGEFHISCDV